MSNKDGRDDVGRYKHTTLDKLCTCGHTLGVHSAEKVAGKRPCFAGDFGSEHCDCERTHEKARLRSRLSRIRVVLGTRSDD